MQYWMEEVLSSVRERLGPVSRELDRVDRGMLVVYSVGGTLAVCGLLQVWRELEGGVWGAAHTAILRLVRKIPWVERKIQAELEENMDSLQEGLQEQMKGLTYLTGLPSTGWNKEKVITEVNVLLNLGDFKVESGSLSGTCHKPQTDRVDLVTEVLAMSAYTNPLNPDAFPGIRKMEAEVVRMVGELFHAGPGLAGTMTSGGTESLILAVLAYRGYARETRGVTRPNIVIPNTGHVALDKAGHLLGVAVRHVEVQPDTLTPRLCDIRRACDSNTVMLLASAPQYAHGIMDPVADIAALGKKLNIPVHVDACLGGFLIAFAQQVGLKLEPFDFRLDGVTSISADTHKFGYAPKGSSVIMYSSSQYVHHQYYISTDWTGGIFVSPTLAGSRSGGIVAATWATLVHHGLNGYTQATRQILDAAMKVKEGVSAIPGLRVLGNPQLCIIAFTSEEFHIYRLADEMKGLGWMLSCVQFPSAVHLYIVPSHTQEGIVDKFLLDLASATAKILESPKEELTGRAAVYGMAQKIPGTLVRELASQFLDLMYNTRTQAQS